ncbi:MAG TPA: hypothetical protein VKA83_17780 [Methylomirabilota bacterium]|nr:hypothetical protein [Methylomirabilota bacterium]
MPIITLAQQISAGAVGSAYGAETAVLLTTTQVVTLSQGTWYVFPGGSAGGAATVDFSPDGGSTWRTFARGGADTARTGVIVYSDGYNVRIAQATSISTTTTYYTLIKSGV